MNKHAYRCLAAVSAMAFAGLAGAAPANAQETGEPLAVGTPAPDFSLVAATRDGVAPDSVRLRDFRGQTVVLAFFFRARTKG